MAARRSDILIVRHGAGRGRLPGHLQAQLDHVAATAPATFGALRFHETGAGVAPVLDDVCAVVFWLADPLRELYPACYAEAAAIAVSARARAIRVVNPPDALSNSIKTVQARRWRAAGIPTPRHAPFADRGELEAVLATARYPIVIKADQLHVQRGMHVCRSRAEAAAIPDTAIHYPGAVADFVDVREAYRTSAPASVWARFHHKKRAVVLGDRVLPRHVFFSASPIVGYERSTLARYQHRSPATASLLLRLRPADRAALAADYAYARGAPEQPDLLRRATRALDLDCAAIDYSTRSDGSVILWEANPHFAMPGATNYTLARQRRFEERFTAFCDTLVGFFEDLRAHAEEPRSSLRTGA